MVGAMLAPCLFIFIEWSASCQNLTEFARILRIDEE